MNFLISLLLAMHLLMPIGVQAQTQTKDIMSYDPRQWALFLGMALLGGVVNWWGKVRRGEVPITSVSVLIGELCTSAFAGLLAFFICEWANFPQMLTAALTGICGHMGTRAVAMFERWAEQKFTSVIIVPQPSNTKFNDE